MGRAGLVDGFAEADGALGHRNCNTEPVQFGMIVTTQGLRGGGDGVTVQG
jgi:hypothetical protein